MLGLLRLMGVKPWVDVVADSTAGISASQRVSSAASFCDSAAATSSISSARSLCEARAFCKDSNCWVDCMARGECCEGMQLSRP